MRTKFTYLESLSIKHCITASMAPKNPKRGSGSNRGGYFDVLGEDARRDPHATPHDGEHDGRAPPDDPSAAAAEAARVDPTLT